MIKFFRNIRLRLLTQTSTDPDRQRVASHGKFSKPASPAGRYLIYAFGEIILVVMGILIALSINNWNTNKHNRNLEAKIIKELQKNLQYDLQEMQTDIGHMDTLQRACEYLLDYFQNHTRPSQKLSYEAAKLRVATHFDPNTSGYNLLTSKGLETIHNDSLRMSISQLYETQYPYYNKYENERIQYRMNFTLPITEEYFTMIPRPDLTYKGQFQVSQEDYEVLRKDESFRKMLNTVIYENALLQSRAKSTAKQIKELLAQLKQEQD